MIAAHRSGPGARGPPHEEPHPADRSRHTAGRREVEHDKDQREDEDAGPWITGKVAAGPRPATMRRPRARPRKHRLDDDGAAQHESEGSGPATVMKGMAAFLRAWAVEDPALPHALGRGAVPDVVLLQHPRASRPARGEAFWASGRGQRGRWRAGSDVARLSAARRRAGRPRSSTAKSRMREAGPSQKPGHGLEQEVEAIRLTLSAALVLVCRRDDAERHRQEDGTGEAAASASLDGWPAQKGGSSTIPIARTASPGWRSRKIAAGGRRAERRGTAPATGRSSPSRRRGYGAISSARPRSGPRGRAAGSPVRRTRKKTAVTTPQDDEDSHGAAGARGISTSIGG